MGDKIKVMTEALKKSIENRIKELYEDWNKNPVSELIPAEIHNLKNQLGIDRYQELKDLGFEFDGFTGTLTYEIKK